MKWRFGDSGQRLSRCARRLTSGFVGDFAGGLGDASTRSRAASPADDWSGWAVAGAFADFFFELAFLVGAVFLFCALMLGRRMLGRFEASGAARDARAPGLSH